MNTQLAPEKIDIEDTRTRVCFVCTGNTCRSPMAAAVLNALYPGRYVASSAGIMCSDGKPMSENSQKALEHAGIYAPPHLSRMITKDIIRDNDIIVGISSSHFMLLLQSFPECAGKLEAMTHDIGDPFGCDLDTYEKCLESITECIKERFA